MSPEKVPESEAEDAEAGLELEPWSRDADVVRAVEAEREVLVRAGSAEVLRGVRPEVLEALRRGPGFASSKVIAPAASGAAHTSEAVVREAQTFDALERKESTSDASAIDAQAPDAAARELQALGAMPPGVHASDTWAFDARASDALSREAQPREVKSPVAVLRPARRWRGPAAGLAVAASIAAVVLIGAPEVFRGARAEAPSGALERHFRGALEASRGTGGAPPSRVYAAAGTMRIEVAQGPGEPIAAASLRVFEVDAGGRLRALPMRIQRVEDGGTTAFVAEEKVSALFGETAGPRTLAIVVAGLSSDLRALAGVELASVRARRELRCFVETIELAGGDSAPR